VTIIKDQSLAEEITQNTFFKAMTSKKQFEGRSSELSWLCGIAKHLAMDEHRKNARLSELDEKVAVPSVDLEKETEDKDTVLQIHLILHELQEPYKEVFQLRVFGELSFSQIGMIFGKTENWARVTYHRARIKIQERMGKNE
jgi:RNA polymerase sigma-70 factor (ECF subfamily)